MERKMATVRVIDEIKPIDGADSIEVATVGGWKVVVKKGEHNAGDVVVFCEIDSFVPTKIAPFLTKQDKFPKEYLGVQGERLRTIKLRGQISQGLILPLNVLGREEEVFAINQDSIGADVSEQLGITKWEAPEEAGTFREAKGNFPHFLRKTDQERVQNIKKELQNYAGESFEATIKIDGSSLTVYHFNGEIGVCSRNIELKECEGNAFWDIVKKENLHNKLKSLGKNLAIQGELIAPNIQKNHEKVTRPEFHCFSIWDIDEQEYLLPAQRRALCRDMDIPHVPVLDGNFILKHSVEELLAYAEGEGMYDGVKREGVVFKHNNSQFSFKAVSNSYLLKNQ